jgi:hypothetical protein
MVGKPFEFDNGDRIWCIGGQEGEKYTRWIYCFKGAFSNYFITVALGIGISTFVSIAIFSFIDTDAAAYLNEQILIVTKESMERFNAPEELVAETLLEASKKDNFSIATQLQNYVFFLAFISLLGLIVAAIIKKSDTNKA